MTTPPVLEPKVAARLVKMFAEIRTSTMKIRVTDKPAMDASNALPTTASQTNGMTQPFAKPMVPPVNFFDQVSICTIK